MTRRNSHTVARLHGVSGFALIIAQEGALGGLALDQKKREEGDEGEESHVAQVIRQERECGYWLKMATG